MKIAIAQMKGFLGDFEENRKKASSFIEKAANKADLLLFPEGGLFGYPPRDLLFHGRLIERQNREIAILSQQLPPAPALLFPAFARTERGLQNGVFLLEKSKKTRFFAKEFLPDQGVFYESRYFAPGKALNNTFTKKGKKIQILICEDLWRAKGLKKPDILLCLNSSPYTDKKQNSRLKKMRELARKYKCSAFYVNRAGGQDELIFDGGSFILNEKGELKWQGAFFAPDFTIFELESRKKGAKTAKNKPAKTAISRPFLPLQEQKKRAIILGIQDFFAQTGFSKALMGLSGGIDSALAACLAAEALGPENVHGLFLPGPWTRKISFRAAKKTAKNLGMRLTEKDITPLWKTALKFLASPGSPPGPPPGSPPGPQNPLTSQNLQSRIRTLILMAESNESGSLLLGTGNKSELAVGYSSLYGDLSGGLLPIGDLWKTEVYQLAQHINKSQLINKKKPVFPEEALLRAPSAELAPRQKDSDDLLPYSELDPFLRRALLGGAPQTPGERKMAILLENSEFKRKQAPPILKISELAFGEGRRIPIARKGRLPP